ncbi:hypothetical protein GIB67_035502 [Kingdonia uniflora]|uniref:Uncharacterized protein n=1 Tax=Kingdonia uniflora TaxID=39325 RepID=A0A7J7MCC5_9MAGN|nr:hypothetical protein GIB67_035502 [Kingdonia uniflora]
MSETQNGEFTKGIGLRRLGLKEEKNVWVMLLLDIKELPQGRGIVTPHERIIIAHQGPVSGPLPRTITHCTDLLFYNLFLAQLGMGSALETLCGQAYGAGKLDMLGIYMQRSWVIHLLTGLLILPVYIFSSLLLKLLGQSAEIFDLAGKLSIWMIPQLFAYALNFPMQKFLQAQSKVFAMMWISFGVLVFHSFLSWLCIRKLDMGLLGAALTLNLSWWLMVLGQLAYILLGSFKESWTGFSWPAFADLSGFVRLFCFICDALVRTLSGNYSMNVKVWLFMVPLGFMAAIRLALACHILLWGHLR